MPVALCIEAGEHDDVAAIAVAVEVGLQGRASGSTSMPERATRSHEPGPVGSSLTTR